MYAEILRHSSRQLIARWDATQHPRDDSGRFAVTVGGRQVAVVAPRRAALAGDVLAPLDVPAFDTAFQRETGFYLGVGGKPNAIHDRYERFGDYIAGHDSIEASEITVNDDGKVGFTNGRHRYAWLRDHGIMSIPAAMTRESVRNAKRHGYLAIKWEEDQHPRGEDGQFISAASLEVIHTVASWSKPLFGNPSPLSSDNKAVAGQIGHVEVGMHARDTLGQPMVWIGHMEAVPMKKGHGRKFLQRLTALADEKGVTLALEPHPIEPEKGARIPLEKLKTFYTSLGFVLDESGSLMTRPPRKVQKKEHTYSSVQIQLTPTSAAYLCLNAARDTIQDAHLMGDGKDVGPNHVTVRFGLLPGTDVDRLRSFIARQEPFEALLGEIELFDPSEHSDGAVPVVVQIYSPELHAIEAEIGNYGDFKEKSFPTYKPHSTLAYVHPDKAPLYADLFVHGSFVVQDMTISHSTGVKETIPFGMAQKKEWEETKHPRDKEGQFIEVFYGVSDAVQSVLNGERVNLAREDVRTFLDQAKEQVETVNLTHVHVEGMQIFGGNGLGIKREDMPQVPRKHREQFMNEIEGAGVTITRELVDPLTLKPTQKEVSANQVATMLDRIDGGDDSKPFAPPLVSNEDRLLDGHHHWGAMAAFAIDDPTARMPIYRLHVTTKYGLALMHAYDKKYGIVRKAMGQKADKTGRYVTPFVSFDRQGDEQLRMIASLNSSRLATWGFTAEAEVLGMARYKLTAVLDGRTSRFCRLVDGKVFSVPDARRKVIEVLNVQDPEDLKVVQPWPKQTKQALAEFSKMTPVELTERGLHIPPFHPHCRTICRAVQSSIGEVKETVPTIPMDTEAFQLVTQADLKALGVDATPAQVDQWNTHVGMTPTELLSKFSGMTPSDVMIKGKGVGSRPILFQPDGSIGFDVRGAHPQGVEFKLGALLDPFTGTYYLSYAQLLKGSPKAEVAFLKQVFHGLIEMGLKSSAESIAVGVAGNAAYYARLGFLPDEGEWDSLRNFSLGQLSAEPLQSVLASLTPFDRLLVEHLLQDKSVAAMTALVELPFTYQGKTIGEWLFGEAAGTWALDLTDDVVVAQAKAYLS